MESQNKISDTAALMHLLKQLTGLNILGAPYAMKNAGILLGPICLVVISVISFHGMHVLVKCAQHLSRQEGVNNLDYADVIVLAAQTSSISFVKHHAKKFKWFLNTILLLLQLGLCTSYYVFIGQNIRQLLTDVWPNLPSDRAFIAMSGVLMLFLSFIGDLKILAWFSTLANLCSVSAIGLMMWLMMNNMSSLTPRPLTADLSSLLYFWGMAFYMFEGIALILYVRNSMKEPEHFHWVLNIAGVIATIVFTTFGVIGYLKFGEAVCGSVILNILPVSDPYIKAVKALYCLAIVVTWLLQFYVPVQIALTWFQESTWRRIKEACLRIALALITCIFAVAIPDIGDLISLTGALGITLISLVVPAFIELLIAHSSLTLTEEDAEKVENHRCWFGITKWIIIKDVVIILVGFFGCIAGTSVAIRSIIINLITSSSKSVCRGGVGGNDVTHTTISNYSTSTGFSINNPMAYPP